MVLFRAAALGAALWVTAAPAQALEMRLVGSTLHLSGPLGWGSHHGFKAFVDSQPKGAIRVVALDSGGGSVESAQEIGRRVRKEGWSTLVGCAQGPMLQRLHRHLRGRDGPALRGRGGHARWSSRSQGDARTGLSRGRQPQFTAAEPVQRQRHRLHDRALLRVRFAPGRVAGDEGAAEHDVPGVRPHRARLGAGDEPLAVHSAGARGMPVRSRRSEPAGSARRLPSRLFAAVSAASTVFSASGLRHRDDVVAGIDDSGSRRSRRRRGRTADRAPSRRSRRCVTVRRSGACRFW